MVGVLPVNTSGSSNTLIVWEFSFNKTIISLTLVGYGMVMLWFNFILGSNFIFLCFWVW